MKEPFDSFDEVLDRALSTYAHDPEAGLEARILDALATPGVTDGRDSSALRWFRTGGLVWRVAAAAIVVGLATGGWLWQHPKAGPEAHSGAGLNGNLKAGLNPGLNGSRDTSAVVIAKKQLSSRDRAFVPRSVSKAEVASSRSAHRQVLGQSAQARLSLADQGEFGAVRPTAEELLVSRIGRERPEYLQATESSGLPAHETIQIAPIATHAIDPPPIQLSPIPVVPIQTASVQISHFNPNSK